MILNKLSACVLAIYTIVLTTVSFAQYKYNDNIWYSDYISKAAELELIPGIENIPFQSETYISNDEFIASVMKLTDEEQISSVANVDYAVKCGYVLEDEISDVNAYITRQKMAKIISRVLKLPETDINNMSDRINDWEDTCPKCKDAIARCYAYGIMSGYDDGMFRGRYSATYPEAAAVLINAYKYRGVISNE